MRASKPNGSYRDSPSHTRSSHTCHWTDCKEMRHLLESWVFTNGYLAGMVYLLCSKSLRVVSCRSSDRHSIKRPRRLHPFHSHSIDETFPSAQVLPLSDLRCAQLRANVEPGTPSLSLSLYVSSCLYLCLSLCVCLCVTYTLYSPQCLTVEATAKLGRPPTKAEQDALEAATPAPSWIQASNWVPPSPK